MAKRKKVADTYKGIENRERYQAMMGKRFSNAAAPHTLKPKKGTRSAKNTQAIKDFY